MATSGSRICSEYSRLCLTTFGGSQLHSISSKRTGSVCELSKSCFYEKFTKFSKLAFFNSFGGSSLSSLNSLIKFSTQKLTDRSQLEALRNFDDNELQEGRTIKQAIERAEANIAWLEKNYKKIVLWLEENSD